MFQTKWRLSAYNNIPSNDFETCLNFLKLLNTMTLNVFNQHLVNKKFTSIGKLGRIFEKGNDENSFDIFQYAS